MKSGLLVEKEVAHRVNTDTVTRPRAFEEACETVTRINTRYNGNDSESANVNCAQRRPKVELECAFAGINNSFGSRTRGRANGRGGGGITGIGSSLQCDGIMTVTVSRRRGPPRQPASLSATVLANQVGTVLSG